MSRVPTPPTLDDLKKQCRAVEGHLKKELYDFSMLSGNVVEAMSAITKNEYGPEENSRFLNTTFIPKIVITLLERQNLPDRSLEAISYFFGQVLDYFSVLMKQGDVNVELIETVTKILDAKHSFYGASKRDDIEETSDSDSEEEDEESFFIKKKLRKESQIYEELINDKVQSKFLRRVRTKIESFNDWANLEKLKFYIKIFSKLKNYFTRRPWEEAVDCLKSTLPKILDLTDEQLKNVKRKTITEITNLYGGLSKIENDEEQVNQEIDAYDLKVCLKFFVSPYLEKRLMGLNDLRSHIDSIHKKEYWANHSPHSGYNNMMNMNMMNMNKAKAARVTLTRESLLDWFDKNQIMEKIYVYNIHPEVIKRATDIPKFYCKNDKFTKQHVDLIWSATIGRHESVLQAVFSSLYDLSEDLPLDCVDYLYEKLISIPPQNIDQQTWSLINQVSQRGIKTRFASNNNKESNNEQENNLEKRLYIIEFTWNLLQDEHLDWNVAYHASTQFTNFITWEMVPQEVKQEYLDKSIENVRNHKASLIGLQTIEKVVESFYHGRVHSGSNQMANLKSQLMETIETSHNLMDLVIKDLMHYKQQVLTIIKEQKLSNVTDSNSMFVGKLSHSAQIRQRLEFLKYCLLVSTGISLNAAQIDVLWNETVTTAIMPDDRDTAWAWWSEILDGYNQGSFTMDNLLYIFDVKFSSLDFTDLSPKGYTCFNHYFKFVNWKKDNVYWSEMNFYATSAEFVGISTLWRVALDCRNEEVGRLSIQQLNELNTRVASALRPQLPQIRRNYIQTCMHYLMGSYSHDPSIDKNKLRIQRCLSVLNTLLENSQQVKNSHGSRRGPLWHINLSLVNQESSKQVLEIYSNETLAQLFVKIQEKVGRPMNEFRVVCNGRDLKLDENTSLTLKECRLDDGVTMHIVLSMKKTEGSSGMSNQRAVPPRPDKKTTTEGEGDLPGEILHDQTYLDQLFSLLELDTETAQMAWSVLMMVPTNGKYLQDVRAFTGDWNVLLDSRSSFKLLYMIQIIDRFTKLDNATDQVMEAEDRQQWRDKFFATGGVLRLINIILNNDIKISAGGKAKTCLANILRVVNSFLVGQGDKEKTGGAPFLIIDRFESLLKQNMDVNQLINQILSMNISSSSSERDGQDYEVVDGSLLLLEAICSSSPANMTLLAQNSLLEKWLRSVILQCPNPHIRKRAVALVSRVSGAHPVIRMVFLQHMLSIFQTAGSQIQTAEQFFEILNELVSGSIDTRSAQSDTASFVSLLENVARLLREHTMIEKRNNDVTDYVLIGILNLLRTLLIKLPEQKARVAQKEGLLHQVFSTCLFDTPTVENHGVDAPPKCKRENTRKAAYHLLYELINGCNENFGLVVDKLIDQNIETSKSKARNSAYSALDKSKAGYVGLENLGATCYMNSLFQQLYMVPQFRVGLLQAPDKEADKNESMLYQLQVILSNLQESEKKFCDTTPFCKTYKDWEGKAMKVNEQQDVEEFFNMLFDKLETHLKGSDQEKLMANFFGGQTSNQIISKSCPHVSERVEQFFTLGLDVKSKKDIKESLEAFVQGDMLDGSNQYHCGTCDAKVDALKRTCIKTLPDNLILCLKRFEFDLEAMKRIKINDYVHFPMHLDMKPYTKEGLAKREGTQVNAGGAANDESVADERPDEYYQYELAGVLVHKGTADYGHYYSFVRERQPLANGVKPEWLSFNDTVVETFDISELEKQCFGGSESSTSWDGNKHVTRNFTKQHNAYMLFYQRLKPERPEPILPVVDAAKKVPREIFTEIWRENLDLFRDERMLDPEYFTFVWDSIKLEGGSPVQTNVAFDFNHPTMKIIKLFIFFIIYTVSKARDNTNTPDFVEMLNQKFSKYIPACRWFLEMLLEDDGAIVRDLLLAVNLETTRVSFAKVICHVLRTFAPLERPFYPRAIASNNTVAAAKDNDVMEEDSSNKSVEAKADEGATQKSIVIKFMDSHIKMMDTCHKYWRKYDQFFQVFSEFATIGDEEREYLIDSDIILLFNNFYLAVDDKKPKMGEKKIPARVGNMIILMSILGRCFDTEADREPNTSAPPTQYPGKMFKLEGVNRKILLQMPLYDAMLKSDLNIATELSELINHFAWENKTFSGQIIETITKAVDTCGYEKFKYFWTCLFGLMNMKDSFQMRNTQAIITQMVKVINNNLNYKLATQSAVRFLVEVVTGRREVVKIGKFDKEESTIEQHAPNLEAASILSACKQSWIESWLFFSAHEGVREATEELIKGLVTNTLHADNSTVLDDAATAALKDIYKLLLTYYLPIANKQVNKGVDKERYVSFARLLKFCTRTVEDVELLHEHLAQFMTFLLSIDATRQELDLNKKELVIYLRHCIDIAPKLIIPFLVESSSFHDRMFDYCATVNNMESYQKYNNSSLCQWYEIMSMCSEHSSEFLDKWAVHNNYTWAVNSIYFQNRKLQPTIDQLHRVFVLACAKDPKFRKEHIGGALRENALQMPVNHDNLLRAFRCLLVTPEDYITFISKNGLEKFSAWISSLAERATRPGQFELTASLVADLLTAFDVIDKCIRIMAPSAALYPQILSKQLQLFSNYDKQIHIEKALQQHWDGKSQFVSGLYLFIRASTTESPETNAIVESGLKMIENLSVLDTQWETLLSAVSMITHDIEEIAEEVRKDGSSTAKRSMSYWRLVLYICETTLYVHLLSTAQQQSRMKSGARGKAKNKRIPTDSEDSDDEDSEEDEEEQQGAAKEKIIPPISEELVAQAAETGLNLALCSVPKSLIQNSKLFSHLLQILKSDSEIRQAVQGEKPVANLVCFILLQDSPMVLELMESHEELVDILKCLIENYHVLFPSMEPKMLVKKLKGKVEDALKGEGEKQEVRRKVGKYVESLDIATEAENVKEVMRELGGKELVEAMESALRGAGIVDGRTEKALKSMKSKMESK